PLHMRAGSRIGSGSGGAYGGSCAPFGEMFGGSFPSRRRWTDSRCGANGTSWTGVFARRNMPTSCRLWRFETKLTLATWNSPSLRWTSVHIELLALDGRKEPPKHGSITNPQLALDLCIPCHAGHPFHGIAVSDSTRSRSLIPRHPGHR